MIAPTHEVECRVCGVRMVEPGEHNARGNMRCPGGATEFGLCRPRPWELPRVESTVPVFVPPPRPPRAPR